MSVAAAVLLRRLVLGMTRVELAAEIGRDVRWLDELESKRRTPTVDELVALARALGFPVDMTTRMAAELDEGVAALVEMERCAGTWRGRTSTRRLAG